MPLININEFLLQRHFVLRDASLQSKPREPGINIC